MTMTYTGLCQFGFQDQEEQDSGRYAVLVHAPCDTVVATVDDGGTLDTLVARALAHAAACEGGPS